MNFRGLGAWWLLCVLASATGFAEAPYAIPWQLRPTAPATLVRSDSSFVVWSPSGGSQAATLVSMLTLSYRPSKKLTIGPFVRLGLAHHDTARLGGSALLNPVIGASYLLMPIDGLRLNFFLALTLPVGMGGGDAPEPAAAAAVRAGVLARSAMDNAMFAVNDFTVFPGVGVSYSRWGFTVQVEATLLQLTRVRGERVSPDASRTNFTSGAHLAYFARDWLSVGAELRYQRWLSTPKAVKTEALRDNLTFAVGPRIHVKGRSFWARPGFSITVPFDEPMANLRMTVVQLDVPVVF